MHIKTTMGYHLTPVRMAAIKKTRNNKHLLVYGDMGMLMRYWDYKLVQPLGKTVWRFLKKLKIELPDDLAILILGI